MTNYLISGDPLAPCDSDLIAQTASLPVGDRVPDGWRVLTGNARFSQIARVVLRCELELEASPIRLRQTRNADGASVLVPVESGK